MKTNKMMYSFQMSAKGDNVHDLYIYDDITADGNLNWNTWEYEESETSANYFKQQLDSIPDGDKINLYINSNGGSVKEGIAIYNMLLRKDCEVTTYIDGFAYSVASVIAMAGDKIVMGLGSSMMIHNAWVYACGNAKELRQVADNLDTLMEANRKIYLERAKNLTEEELIEMMDKETTLTPQQCLELGFCDEIAERKVKEETKEIKESKREEVFNLKEEYCKFIAQAGKRVEKEHIEETVKVKKHNNTVNAFLNLLNSKGEKNNDFKK